MTKSQLQLAVRKCREEHQRLRTENIRLRRENAELEDANINLRVEVAAADQLLGEAMDLALQRPQRR